ncbi:MAG: DMT family transporter [Pseudomonadota bacterium]
MPEDGSQDRRALVLGLCAVLFWSTAATAFKLALADLSVIQLVSIAVSVSAIVLIGYLAARGQLSALLLAIKRRTLFYLVMATVNPLIYYSILLAAYDALPAQQAQTINYTWAIMLALLSIPFLGQRLQVRDWTAVFLGYIGVVIIATEGRPWDLAFTNLNGLLLALVSTVVWAVFWLLSTRNDDDPAVALCANFCLAAPAAFFGTFLLGDAWPASAQGYLSAVYVGLFEMGVTWLLWSYALRLASNVSRVANLIFLAPVLSLGFIATILGESINPATILGLALILPGIVLQQRGQRRQSLSSSD